jgi:hypothetical protein
VFPDVFVVTGRVRAGLGVVIPRTMTVVRQGGELVLINAMRLTADGEAALEKLGRPAHLLRLGANHGVDDAYCVARWGLALWAPPGAKDRGVAVTHALSAGATLPLADATLFAFERARADVPERAVVLGREGGLLVVCDSVQNWTRETFAECSFAARPMMKLLGFGPAQVGVVWKKQQEAGRGVSLRADYDRLLERPFRHLLMAHGEPLRDTARDAVAACVQRAYGPRA